MKIKGRGLRYLNWYKLHFIKNCKKLLKIGRSTKLLKLIQPGTRIEFIFLFDLRFVLNSFIVCFWQNEKFSVLTNINLTISLYSAEYVHCALRKRMIQQEHAKIARGKLIKFICACQNDSICLGDLVSKWTVKNVHRSKRSKITFWMKRRPKSVC
jgi:hypothetical protein